MKLMKNHEGGIAESAFMILHELHVILLLPCASHPPRGNVPVRRVILRSSQR